MRVLAINVSSLGDLISSLPVIDGLIRRYSNVDFVCSDAFKALIEDEPGLHLIDWTEAEAGRYDVIVDLTSSGSTRRKVARLKGKFKLGRASGWRKRVKARFVYDEIVPKDPYSNLVENYRPLATALALDIPEYPLLTPPQEVELPKPAREFVGSPRLKVSFHPFSRDRLRTLPAGLRDQIVEELKSRGAEIFLIGRPEEIPSDNSLPCAALTLRQLKAVLSRSDVFIGADSGPLHLAAYLKVPSLGVFGPTLPATTKPLAPWSIAMDKDFPCRPCNTKRPCRFEHRCLRQLRERDVKSGLDSLVSLSSGDLRQ